MFLAGAVVALARKKPGVAVLALAGLAACGSPPDFVTENGVEFYLDEGTTFRKDRAERMDRFAVELWAKELGVSPSRAAEAMTGVRVQIAKPDGPDGRVKCDAGRCVGYGTESAVTIASATCEYDTAYLHELTHAVLRRLTGNPDLEHAHAVWRNDPGTVFSNVNMLNLNGRRRCD